MKRDLYDLMIESYKINFFKIFNSSTTATENDSKNYSINNLVNALVNLLINNDYSYFSRDNNIRNDIVNYGPNNIKKELLINLVLTYDYNKRNDKELSKYLNYNLLEIKKYDELIASLYLNLFKNGVHWFQSLFKDKKIVTSLSYLYVSQIINNNNYKNMNEDLLEENRFLIVSIENYYASILGD